MESATRVVDFGVTLRVWHASNALSLKIQMLGLDAGRVAELHLHAADPRWISGDRETHPHLEHAAGFRPREKCPEILREIGVNRRKRVSGKIGEGKRHDSGQVSIVESSHLNIQVPGPPRGRGRLDR